MEIRLVSSLTPEDEERVASAFLPALTGLLDMLPIAYSIQVKTTSGKMLDRTHATPGAAAADAATEPGGPSRPQALNREALDPLKLLVFNHQR